MVLDEKNSMLRSLPIKITRNNSEEVTAFQLVDTNNRVDQILETSFHPSTQTTYLRYQKSAIEENFSLSEGISVN